MSKERQAVLEIRLIGPGVEQGRVYISDLVLLGQKLQGALNRAASLPFANLSSRRPRLPKEVKDKCALQLVALKSGSVLLELDLPRDEPTSEGSEVGVEDLERLFSGIQELHAGGRTLLEGHDLHLLMDWKGIGEIFEVGHGIDRIEFCLTTHGRIRHYELGPETLAIISDRHHNPTPSVRTIEGWLLMANFESIRRHCRVHPRTGPPVKCTFDERIADEVKSAITKFVRVTGKAKIEPDGERIKSFKITEMQVLDGVSERDLPRSEEFWRAKTLGQLASEQGVRPVARFEEILGKGANLWASDAEFEKFVQGIYERRKEDEEPGSRLARCCLTRTSCLT